MAGNGNPERRQKRARQHQRANQHEPNAADCEAPCNPPPFSPPSFSSLVGLLVSAAYRWSNADQRDESNGGATHTPTNEGESLLGVDRYLQERNAHEAEDDQLGNGPPRPCSIATE